MSCTTIICLNPLCGYLGFKSLDVCPQCGGPIHEQFDEVADNE